MTAPSRAIREASHAGTRPPCSGKSALPVRPIRTFSILPAEAPCMPEAHQAALLGRRRDRIRTDAPQPARRALGAAPHRFEERLGAIDGVEVLGDEAELEVALALRLRAQARAGQVRAAEIDPRR